MGTKDSACRAGLPRMQRINKTQEQIQHNARRFVVSLRALIINLSECTQLRQRMFTNSKFFFLLLLALGISACTTIAGKETTGVIIARRAQVRSSIAVVAADLTQVN